MIFRAIVLFGLLAISGGVFAQPAQDKPQHGEARPDSREKRAALRATLKAQREAQRPARAPDGPLGPAVREMSSQERTALRQQLRQQRRPAPVKPPPH